MKDQTTFLLRLFSPRQTIMNPNDSSETSKAGNSSASTLKLPQIQVLPGTPVRDSSEITGTLITGNYEQFITDSDDIPESR